MRFEDLLEIVDREPVFETGLLLAGDVDPADVRRQLSRWVNAGRLYQLRRGLYALAPPFQKVRPHPFLIANRLVPGSYVSLQSVLAQHSLIPEYVPVTTSVTNGRPGRWDTPLGSYLFQHLQADLLTGFHRVALTGGQEALCASPEKALLDLVYLEPDADSPEYLAELRLQNLEEVLDLTELRRLAEASGKPKLRRATERIIELAEIEAREYRYIQPGWEESTLASAVPLRRQRSELPVVRAATERVLPALTSVDIDRLLEEEEIARAHSRIISGLRN